MTILRRVPTLDEDGRFPDRYTPAAVIEAVDTVTAIAEGLPADADAAVRAATEAVDITVGTVTTGTPGTPADAAISGDAPAFTLDLTIPRGDPGLPNRLAIGTVTTGAPGSAADASVTGTAPEQVLNLTIPQGATGAVSAWEYYAAGRPDVVGTLDAAALAWRNAAPSGSTFYSTDGPQGAWVWRKRGAAWECVEGDTGDQWVALAVPLAAGGQIGFGARVRRDAFTASLTVNYSGQTVTPPLNAVHTVGDTPTWARPAVGGAIAIIGAATGGGDLQAGTSFMSVGAAVKMRFGADIPPWGEATYRASGAWPTSFAITSLPAGVTSIGAEAFRGCTSLTLTSLPDGVTSIGSSAFRGCTSLALTSLPDGVTSIGSSAFSGCTSLAEVVCNAPSPPALGSGVFTSTHPSLVIRVPAASVDAYKTAAGWSAYAARIQAI